MKPCGIMRHYLGAGSSILIMERARTDFDQTATSKNLIVLEGDSSKANMTSRSVIKGDSVQNFYVNLEARAKSYGQTNAMRLSWITAETGGLLRQTRAFHPDGTHP